MLQAFYKEAKEIREEIVYSRMVRLLQLPMLKSEIVRETSKKSSLKFVIAFFKGAENLERAS